ncbi:MAG TPA: hypothetical protein VGM86_29550 [Thermoanaerobaculia bacterium]|jgi:hypothetical protein
MGLKEVLSKMKIVEIDPDEAAAAVPPAVAPFMPGKGPPPPPGMPADIQSLLGTIPEPPEIDERKLPPPPAGGGDDGADIPDFPAVYKAAGVVDPPHGYSAYKVLEIFASPGFAALDTRAKAAALTGFLNMNPSGPVPITDVVQDAVRRDQALDKFEDFLRNKLGGRSEQIDKENAQLQAEIDEVTRRNREKMEANRATLEAEQARFTRWLTTKRAEERKLFDAVNPFVEHNPISTADTPRPAEPAAPEKTPG